MRTVVPRHLHQTYNVANNISLLKECDGYYECLKDEGGRRQGPLVGYAGKYDTPEGKKQYVGDVYVNFAKAEQHAPVLGYYAEQLLHKLAIERNDVLRSSTGFCGAPEGGKALAYKLADLTRLQYIYPEKEVLKVKSETGREESKLVFDRHEPDIGDIWWIVEDVCNNFSTTADLIALIERYHADVAGIVCFWNRSKEVDKVFQVGNRKFPVISLVRQDIPQYRQDDPYVAADVARGNVVWKPKNEWAKLRI